MIGQRPKHDHIHTMNLTLTTTAYAAYKIWRFETADCFVGGGSRFADLEPFWLGISGFERSLCHSSGVLPPEAIR